MNIIGTCSRCSGAVVTEMTEQPSRLTERPKCLACNGQMRGFGPVIEIEAPVSSPKLLLEQKEI